MLTTFFTTICSGIFNWWRKSATCHKSVLIKIPRLMLCPLLKMPENSQHTFLSPSLSIATTPLSQMATASSWKAQHGKAYPFWQLVQLWAYLTHAQVWLPFTAFAGKLNLSQSMELRIRRVSRVTKRRRTLTCSQVAWQQVQKPKKQTQTQTETQSDPTTAPCYSLHWRCWCCLQHFAAQRRRRVSPECVCVWVGVCHAPRLLATLGSARLLSFRVWQQPQHWKSCFICTWRIHQSGFYITWYFRCLFRFIFIFFIFSHPHLSALITGLSLTLNYWLAAP